MKLREVMTSPPIFVYQETPLWRAARAMREKDCSFLPVVQRGVPIGVMTSQDLEVAVSLNGKCPFATMASEIMNDSPVGLPADADLEEAAELMRQRNVRHLVVTDEQQILRGVVSLRDLNRTVDDFALEIAVQSQADKAGHGLAAALFGAVPDFRSAHLV